MLRAKQIWIFFLLLASPLLAVETVAEKTKSASPLEVGLAMDIMVPDHLPDFSRTVPVYGPHIGIPLGEDTLQVSAVYGSAERISLFLAEIDYRFNFTTPFLKTYALAGAGYMHYGFNRIDHDFVMPIAGIGFYFPMVRNFAMSLNMKIYFPENTMLQFGGQFAYLFEGF